jgi:hypothetical protein
MSGDDDTTASEDPLAEGFGSEDVSVEELREAGQDTNLFGEAPEYTPPKVVLHRYKIVAVALTLFILQNAHLFFNIDDGTAGLPADSMVISTVVSNLLQSVLIAIGLVVLGAKGADYLRSNEQEDDGK